jgi:MoCo/4Fe-4S cofactor protein with predicted Tat translocation signal
MKTIPPPVPSRKRPEVLAQLDQLADTPEFRQWVEREFPAGASEFTDPVSRRNFVKIMSASFLLAGLGATGCRRPVGEYLSVRQNAGELRPRRAAIFCHRHADAPHGHSAGGQIQRWPADQDRGQSRSSRTATAARIIWRRLRSLSLYDPDRAMRCARNGSAKAARRRWIICRRWPRTLGDGSGWPSCWNRAVRLRAPACNRPSRKNSQRALACL